MHHSTILLSLMQSLMKLTKFFFVPSDWTLSDDLMAWTKRKGLSDKSIEDEIESFRDHQYKRAMMRPDACWRNWVKNGIKWGNIETVSNSQYRRPQEISEEQRSQAQTDFDNDPKILAWRNKT